MIRAFVAVNLSEIFAAEFQILFQSLRKLPLRARWTPLHQLHLTLHFFGNIAEKKLPEIEAAISEVTRRTPAMMLQLKSLGVFPESRRPKILWAGLSGETNLLLNLQKDIQNQLQSLGFAIESRDFVPHVTLARFPDPVKLDPQILPTRYVCPLKKVAGVALMKSELHASGAVHHQVRFFPLSR